MLYKAHYSAGRPLCITMQDTHDTLFGLHPSGQGLETQSAAPSDGSRPPNHPAPDHVTETHILEYQRAPVQLITLREAGGTLIKAETISSYTAEIRLMS